jgi:hypothetical protein
MQARKIFSAINVVLDLSLLFQYWYFFYFSEKLLDSRCYPCNPGWLPGTSWAADLLQEASGRVLRMREVLDVRDSLCLQLVLGNAKRGGDITHIRAEGSKSRKDTGNLS